MRVSDVMTPHVQFAHPEQSLQQAATLMAELDIGALPVGENNRLVGMITDRDIAVRAVAEHKGPDAPIREVMTKEVKYCFEDEDLQHVAANMGDLRVRRLPVVNRDKRLVGILSLGDIAMVGGRGAAGKAVIGISRPGGPHSQTPPD
jgi:CBS domain-containing protein